MVNNGYRFRLAFHCQSLHPGNQFTEAERLPQVIVRPKPETEHDIVHRRTGTQKQYGHLLIHPANAANHLEAVHLRHHHVGNDQCGMLLEILFEPLQTVAGNSNFVTFLFQGIFYDHCQRDFIFY